MLSALRHWSDEGFRNTLMLLVSEEAPFYQPEGASLSVRSFVVLTVRNSPFETLQSKAFRDTGLSAELTVSQIVKLTRAAVEYFAQLDPATLYCEAEFQGEDLYGTLSRDYPVAWSALYALANTTERVVDYPPAERPEAEEFSREIEGERHSEKLSRYVVKDGFDGTMDSALSKHLYHCKKQKAAFFSDCFKMISRNPALLLRVLEYILISGIPYVSTNYFLSNGHVERRKNILKAAHSLKEAEKHISNTNGISPLHRQYLLAATRAQ